MPRTRMNLLIWRLVGRLMLSPLAWCNPQSTLACRGLSTYADAACRWRSSHDNSPHGRADPYRKPKDVDVSASRETRSPLCIRQEYIEAGCAHMLVAVVCRGFVRIFVKKKYIHRFAISSAICWIDL